MIIEEAKKLNYTINIISDKMHFFTIKNKKKEILFKNIDCWLNNSLAVKFARQKKLSYFMLWREWIKVPKSIITTKWENIDNILWSLKENKISFPLVIKPSIGEHWNGVSINIKNKEDIIKAIKYALSFHHQIIIQEFFSWEDHRLIVVWWKLISVTQKIPAHVISDGKHTIKKLIDIENTNPLRWNKEEKPLTKISVDEESKQCLRNQWYTLRSTPKKNKEIFLRKNANLSTWWMSIDMTDIVHPEIKNMAEHVAKILWLEICWIDYLSEDIRKPLKKQTWGIIEVNHTPWLRCPHAPAIGKPRNVAKAILQLAFKK